MQCRFAAVVRQVSALLVAVGAACASAPAPAAVWTVDSTTDAVDAVPGDGLCATTSGACSLRAAIQEANADPGADEVVVPAGTFALTLTGANEDLSASGDLDVRAPLTLRGAGPAATTIDGADLDRVLDLHAPGGAIAVALEALALANGRSTEVLSISAGLGLRVAVNVTVQAIDVDVRDNEATSAFGGAVGIDNRGCLNGTRVRVLRNIDPAPPGSGRALAGGVVSRGAASCFELVDSEISGNVGDTTGGVYVDGGAPFTLRRSLLAGNDGRHTGAMLLNQQNAVLLEDTTVSGNRGNGAILNDGGATLTLRNCTVTANAPLQGTAVVGGIHDVHGGFGRTFLTNTILAGNGPGFLADDCSNLTSQGGGNVIGSIASCNASLQASDRTGIDPALGALADNGGATRTHLPGAPALDLAVDAVCTASDQRGVARPQDGDGDGSARCDVGAVELAPDPALFADGFE